MTGKPSTIPVSRTNQSPDLRSFLDKANREFSFSWAKGTLPHPARYALFLDGDKLIATYSCPIAAVLKDGEKSGEFVRGLWEHDVAELFIYSAAAAKYQEFNLSPSGSWWSCLFSEYRVESKETFYPPVVAIESQSDTSGWRAAISIPLQQLAFPFNSLDQLRLNVCLIQGNQPRHYLSAVAIDTKEPDFHHFQSFLPPSLS